MTQSYETAGKAALEQIAEKRPYELLMLLGGALAALLSVVLFSVQWAQGISDNRLADATMLFVVNLVLGAALCVSAAIARKNLMNGAIVAGVVSLILIVYGGQAGTIGGAIGVLGALLAVATPYLPWSRRP